MNDSVSATATFTKQITYHTLTITKTAYSGSRGTITSSLSRISCGSPCSASFVSLEPHKSTIKPPYRKFHRYPYRYGTADYGNTFAGWSNVLTMQAINVSLL